MAQKTRTYKGFKPYFHQKDVVEKLREAKGTGRIITVNSSRQKGKTYMISNVLLFYAINYAKTWNACVSPTLKQSKAIYKVIMDAIGTSGVVKTKNATDLTITLINGSTINFKSAEQRDALRGFTVSGILCIDECAFIPDDVFYLVLPWTDANKAPILMTSTPFIKDGFFYRYFNYGKDLTHNTETIDWTDEKYRESIEAILPPDKLEEYRQVLPKNVFTTEYLGQFLDDDGTVFTNLHNCLKENKIDATDELYVGLDFSNQGENDDTVISIFNQKGEQVFLKYANNLSPLKQIVWIVDELEPYADQINVISCELNSIGTPYTDLIKERSQILEDKVQGFQTSNTSKNAIVLNMQTALEKETVTLLPDDKEIRQFGFFSATYNPKTRNVSYAAPQGLNDDTVMATLIAYNAYREGTTVGSYCVGFAGGNKR